LQGGTLFIHEGVPSEFVAGDLLFGLLQRHESGLLNPHHPLAEARGLWVSVTLVTISPYP
jgi:hypothetical protein